MTQKFRVNTPIVAHDIIEGEAIIVHLEKGHYYSLRNSAVDVWSHIDRGLSEHQIKSEILHKFFGDLDYIDKAIHELLDKLVEEGLIETLNDENDGASQFLTNDQREQLVEKVPFSQPLVEYHTDMEDFLLLDPIHDVNEKGWPNKNE